MIWRRRLFLALFISAFGLGGGCRCSHPAGSDAPTNGQRTPLADAGLVDGSQLLVPSGPTSDVSQRPGMLSPKAEVTILAQPAQLRVLQSTHVTLQAKSPAGRKLHYAWTVDGKKQPQDTPLLVVRFDGRRDARIQLQAWDESGYKRVVERLRADLERAPLDHEVAEVLGLGVVEYQVLFGVGLPGTPSGSSHYEESDESASGIDVVADPRTDAPEERMRRDELMSLLAQRLSVQEYRIVYLKYWEDMPMRAIGELTGLSESRVCKIHTRLIDRLRDRLGVQA